MHDRGRGVTQLTRLGVGGAVTAALAVSALEYPALLVAVGNVLDFLLSVAVALVGFGVSVFAVFFDTLLLVGALVGLVVLLATARLRR